MQAMSRCKSLQVSVRIRSGLFRLQVLVSVACNGVHSLDQRLARWLLMMRDRSDDDALLISQNLIAEMLGVQRPAITNAAGNWNVPG